MEWRNQVAVVTGGARGLGRATARLLAQRGAAVCVNYAVHADAAQALVAEIATAADGLSRWRQTSPTAVKAMVARAEAELALLWQIYSRRCSLQIHFRQCGHRCGNRATSSRMA